MDFTSLETTTFEEVVIALGSNVGNRMNNFKEALRLMKDYGISVTRHSCLYETEPVHVTDQPRFLNAAIRGVTKLKPHELLNVLKKIEKEMGREENGLRYGPRPLDLDILFYGKHKIISDKLIIPHERIWERPFVLAPLVDLLGTEDIDNDKIVAYWHSLSMHSGGIFQAWERLGGESLLGKDGIIQRVIPIGDHLWDFSKKTYVMGILNLTPDSFSDGGKFQSVDTAVSRVRSMISEGVDIIDIGAQSTRPMASRISSQEEIDRLIPVLKVVRGMAEMKGKLISVDTFNSEVALEAIRNGADILNDVSGGSLDENMHKVVADSDVPYMIMHMRGDPCTMQNKENLEYNEICKDVATELYERVREAELSGIPAWRIMIDPGIGFSKGIDHNLDIVMELPKIREEMAKKSIGLSHAPILIGPSRKRFLGDICGRPEASERDAATVACVTAGILKGANIIRVHNVRDNVDAARLCDAMMTKRFKNVD
ncbi:Folate synthesis bifunctional protein [Arabidopsis thaliana]|uniref:Folate synthesis bifunctional protein n=4 Tax=Arabidopsis TaxID=3701 RepID=FOLC_ARATH|nr:Dihydropterin pyrophosphokinase / Dihydropteroate synthase [Arabidopsis thaliana]Q1ENB6.1 RecName: Full=Folate synthesis bifunctional protein; Includes: RecName: Full=6-hydroxymethyl-7,8-dihydropterin pyrophosphokinase; Short=HPPK; AltName: Full=2-amino-4-hydroxy-6-hydroxymethyldihydropteridine diphosphokinase; AltName: Full=7,8-dihydro-6-hydroxymethylpterin-pyrophosphokinase; Short=PPPK; Includes: RecName: Full=Dihydropteroate synthase; Short=DHPS [Arabidopsis thaliana]KAG7651090.1 Pterin-bin|eukprot:NP_001319354.1 Dihydropterin pyrophosphokinase / Dihydropteroate synthase [Arabidopsis thaliana]